MPETKLTVDSNTLALWSGQGPCPSLTDDFSSIADWWTVVTDAPGSVVHIVLGDLVCRFDSGCTQGDFVGLVSNLWRLPEEFDISYRIYNYTGSAFAYNGVAIFNEGRKWVFSPSWAAGVHGPPTACLGIGNASTVFSGTNSFGVYNDTDVPYSYYRIRLRGGCVTAWCSTDGGLTYHQFGNGYPIPMSGYCTGGWMIGIGLVCVATNPAASARVRISNFNIDIGQPSPYKLRDEVDSKTLSLVNNESPRILSTAYNFQPHVEQNFSFADSIHGTLFCDYGETAIDSSTIPTRYFVCDQDISGFKTGSGLTFETIYTYPSLRASRTDLIEYSFIPANQYQSIALFYNSTTNDYLLFGLDHYLALVVIASKNGTILAKTFTNKTLRPDIQSYIAFGLDFNHKKVLVYLNGEILTETSMDFHGYDPFKTLYLMGSPTIAGCPSVAANGILGQIRISNKLRDVSEISDYNNKSIQVFPHKISGTDVNILDSAYNSAGLGIIHETTFSRSKPYDDFCFHWNASLLTHSYLQDIPGDPINKELYLYSDLSAVGPYYYRFTSFTSWGYTELTVPLSTRSIDYRMYMKMDFSIGESVTNIRMSIQLDRCRIAFYKQNPLDPAGVPEWVGVFTGVAGQENNPAAYTVVPLAWSSYGYGQWNFYVHRAAGTIDITLDGVPVLSSISYTLTTIPAPTSFVAFGNLSSTVTTFELWAKEIKLAFLDDGFYIEDIRTNGIEVRSFGRDVLDTPNGKDGSKTLLEYDSGNSKISQVRGNEDVVAIINSVDVTRSQGVQVRFIPGGDVRRSFIGVVYGFKNWSNFYFTLVHYASNGTTQKSEWRHAKNCLIETGKVKNGIWMVDKEYLKDTSSYAGLPDLSSDPSGWQSSDVYIEIRPTRGKLTVLMSLDPLTSTPEEFISIRSSDVEFVDGKVGVIMGDLAPAVCEREILEVNVFDVDEALVTTPSLGHNTAHLDFGQVVSTTGNVLEGDQYGEEVFRDEFDSGSISTRWEIINNGTGASTITKQDGVLRFIVPVGETTVGGPSVVGTSFGSEIIERGIVIETEISKLTEHPAAACIGGGIVCSRINSTHDAELLSFWITEHSSPTARVLINTGFGLVYNQVIPMSFPCKLKIEYISSGDNTHSSPAGFALLYLKRSTDSDWVLIHFGRAISNLRYVSLFGNKNIPSDYYQLDFSYFLSKKINYLLINSPSGGKATKSISGVSITVDKNQAGTDGLPGLVVPTPVAAGQVGFEAIARLKNVSVVFNGSTIPYIGLKPHPCDATTPRLIGGITVNKAITPNYELSLGVNYYESSDSISIPFDLSPTGDLWISMIVHFGEDYSDATNGNKAWIEYRFSSDGIHWVELFSTGLYDFDGYVPGYDYSHGNSIRVVSLGPLPDAIHGNNFVSCLCDYFEIKALGSKIDYVDTFDDLTGFVPTIPAGATISIDDSRPNTSHFHSQHTVFLPQKFKLIRSIGSLKIFDVVTRVEQVSCTGTADLTGGAGLVLYLNSNNYISIRLCQSSTPPNGDSSLYVYVRDGGAIVDVGDPGIYPTTSLYGGLYLRAACFLDVSSNKTYYRFSISNDGYSWTGLTSPTTGLYDFQVNFIPNRVGMFCVSPDAVTPDIDVWFTNFQVIDRLGGHAWEDMTSYWLSGLYLYGNRMHVTNDENYVGLIVKKTNTLPFNGRFVSYDNTSRAYSAAPSPWYISGIKNMSPAGLFGTTYNSTEDLWEADVGFVGFPCVKHWWRAVSASGLGSFILNHTVVWATTTSEYALFIDGIPVYSGDCPPIADQRVSVTTDEGEYVGYQTMGQVGKVISNFIVYYDTLPYIDRDKFYGNTAQQKFSEGHRLLGSKSER